MVRSRLPISQTQGESTDEDKLQTVAGSVEPAPGNRAANVTVLQEFKLGKIASALASIKGRSPRHSVTENLRHFKALAETGEIPRSQTPSHGPRGVIAGWKESLYGEKVPTPVGTAASAKGVR